MLEPIPFGKPIVGDEERNAVLEVLNGTTYVHGPKTKQFESAFAEYTRAPHALSVSSCTAALHLSYFQKKLGPGDEVLVPAQTHAATAHAVELVGAKPIFIDAEKKTGNIDLEQLEPAITSRTKAISVVHYLGMPVNMERVMKVAQKHGLLVVEDCALAIGTLYKGIHAGLWGDAGCFSFYPVKHMTTIEGGMLITRDAEVAKRIERQRAFGVDRTPSERKIPGVYDVTQLGFNYRMNEVEAAVGIEQLKRMPSFLKARKANYTFLAEQLRSIPEISLFESSQGDYESSYYCLSILLNEKLSAKRYEMVQALSEESIGVSIYYPESVPHFKYYREKYGTKPTDTPVARWISHSSIALPVGPHLNTAHMERISETLKNVIVKVKKL